MSFVVRGYSGSGDGAPMIITNGSRIRGDMSFAA